MVGVIEDLQNINRPLLDPTPCQFVKENGVIDLIERGLEVNKQDKPTPGPKRGALLEIDYLTDQTKDCV